MWISGIRFIFKLRLNLQLRASFMIPREAMP